MKFFDFTYDDAAIAVGGTVEDSVNQIAQGVTESQRVGRKCTITAINWRYTLNLPENDAVATPLDGAISRVILFQDRQCNGATAVVLDILETANYQSFRNLSNSGRFNILMDKNHILNYRGLASDGAGVVSQADVKSDHTFYKKCSIPIEFNSTTGAITEIRSNNIGILVISSNGTPGMLSKLRLRFSDN